MAARVATRTFEKCTGVGSVMVPEKHILEVGRQAVRGLGLTGVHEKSAIQLNLGRLKFRTSYSQNVLNHVEVAAPLRHDGGRTGSGRPVGPAAVRLVAQRRQGGLPWPSQDREAELAKRYGRDESKEVLHAIAGHHDDVTIDHIYTVLVASAGAISASRWLARRETLENTSSGPEELEAVASGFPGVEHAYAIQAGPECESSPTPRRRATATHLAQYATTSRWAIEEQLALSERSKICGAVVRETRAVEARKAV